MIDLTPRDKQLTTLAKKMLKYMIEKKFTFEDMYKTTQKIRDLGYESKMSK